VSGKVEEREEQRDIGFLKVRHGSQSLSFRRQKCCVYCEPREEQQKKLRHHTPPYSKHTGFLTESSTELHFTNFANCINSIEASKTRHLCFHFCVSGFFTILLPICSGLPIFPRTPAPFERSFPTPSQEYHSSYAAS
jgi:hypothetical protein